MKKFLFTIGIFLSVITFYGFGGMELLYPGGAPAGYTGSPHDNKNCTYCHGGTPTHVDNIISSTIPETGYVPGETYEITATVSGSGKKGFEISPQNLGGTILGTLHAGSGSQLTGNGGYITHTQGVNANPAVWHFTWTAPAENTGDVVFYGAFAIKKSQTKLSLLTVHEDITAGVRQKPLETFRVYPNPVSGGTIHLSFYLKESGNITVTLYSLQGGKRALIYSSGEDSGNKRLDLKIPGNFPEGTAVVQVKSEKVHFMKKIVII